MINALMTGLGIGLAFWMIVIPTLMVGVRRNGRTQAEANEKSLALLEQRNDTDERICAALWHLVEVLSKK